MKGSCLQDCITRYRDSIPGLAGIALPAATDPPAALIGCYEQCYPLLEQALWSGKADFHTLLPVYQALFREQEALIRQQADSGAAPDERFRFLISIPVADRPAHLRTCLESILQACERFAYGGQEAGIYTHIRIILAEDSRAQDNVRQHLELAADFRQRGLQVIHFGQDEQYELLHSLAEPVRNRLGRLLTTLPRDRFYHKGQAANRNLSVLKCLQLTADRARTLYYFIDSDESLCVNRQTDTGEEAVYAVNYFHYLDRIFRTTNAVLVTGKLVGDPPVSPSVMAVNFLDDVTAFFTRLSAWRGDQDCSFHDPSPEPAAGAIYHDMASLFGYENRRNSWPYRCPLHGTHDHADCLHTFAARLAAFFYGEHLTRKTVFSYGRGFRELTPARTIYPGNTIASYAGLKTVIPFGHLRLRMSGPTAGRLIAAELGDRFVSVNLPHLHRRTNTAGLDQAFRPGVGQTGGSIDLSDEFERQFFGDLMLFTTEQLVTEADVRRPFARASVLRIMAHKEQQLLALYQQKQDAIADRTAQLDRLVFHADHWWLHEPGLTDALQQVSSFIANIRRNFGARSPAWQLIRSAAHRAGRKQQILQALMNYREERDAWDSLFE